MPFSPGTPGTLEIIDLAKGQTAPDGSTWARLTRLAEGCNLEGNLPDIAGRMSPWGVYPNAFDAREAAIEYARLSGVAVLYVEVH